MLVLALDTSTPATTVALVDVGTGTHEVLAEHTEIAANRHGEVLAPLVARCFSLAGVAAPDLGLVAVGTGPGPFTGLRVGLVTARALGAAAGVPVRGVSTLDVIASGRPGPLAVVTDARRRELYWARYDEGGRRADGPGVERPADLAARWLADGFPGPVVGPGVDVQRAALAGLRLVDEPAWPRAAVLAVLATGPLATDPEPLYLRRPDAQPFAAPKPVTS